jgi:hypothetical protein
MTDQAFLGQLITGISVLASLAVTMLLLFRGRQPPLPEEVAKTYATKKELDNLEARFERRFEPMEKKLDTIVHELNANHTDVIESIGELRGEFKKCPYMCKG